MKDIWRKYLEKALIHYYPTQSMENSETIYEPIPVLL